MPVYAFACENKNCGHLFDAMRTIDNRDTHQRCPKCNCRAHRTFCPTPHINAGASFKPFVQKHIDKTKEYYITSKRQYKDVVKRHNDEHPDSQVLIPDLE